MLEAQPEGSAAFHALYQHSRTSQVSGDDAGPDAARMAQGGARWPEDVVSTSHYCSETWKAEDLCRVAPRSVIARGGRKRGTPNKRTQALRQALEAHGCDLAEQIAGVLLDAAVESAVKTDLLTKVLPYVYPQLRPVDPEGYLSPEQAAALLGAQAATVKEALHRHGADQSLVARVLEDLRQPAQRNGASAPAV